MPPIETPLKTRGLGDGPADVAASSCRRTGMRTLPTLGRCDGLPRLVAIETPAKCSTARDRTRAANYEPKEDDILCQLTLDQNDDRCDGTDYPSCCCSLRAFLKLRRTSQSTSVPLFLSAGGGGHAAGDWVEQVADRGSHHVRQRRTAASWAGLKGGRPQTPRAPHHRARVRWVCTVCLELKNIIKRMHHHHPRQTRPTPPTTPPKPARGHARAPPAPPPLPLSLRQPASARALQRGAPCPTFS